MTFHYNSHNDLLGAASQDLLQSMGISLSMGTDFEEYREILAEARPDHALGEPFEPTKYDLSDTKAVWIVGRNDAGKIIHTQAMKRIRLSNMTLGTYLARNLKEFEPSGVSIDYNRSVYRAGPGAKRITGTIVYHGEFWVGGTPRQGMVLSPLLGRHAFITARSYWNPDYTFGFIAKPLAHKGFSARFGFMHNEPNAVRYVMQDTGDVFEGTMGYMDREDLDYVLDVPVSDIMERAA